MMLCTACQGPRGEHSGREPVGASRVPPVPQPEGNSPSTNSRGIAKLERPFPRRESKIGLLANPGAASGFLPPADAATDTVGFSGREGLEPESVREA